MKKTRKIKKARGPEYYAYQEGWLSIVINTTLFALKLWAGIVTSSVALIADGWHSLSDSLTSIVVIISEKISSKPADAEHPYGHGRAELIGSLIIGMLLVVVSFHFVAEAINRLRSGGSAHYGRLGIIVVVVSIILKEALAQYAIRVGKKSGSLTLIADGWHHRSDSISSLIIFIGIFFNPYFWWIDGALGIAVLGVILYAAFSIVKGTVSAFIGERPNDETIGKIMTLSKEAYPEDLGIHHIHEHCYGRHHEITFHIRLPEKTSLKEAHRVASSFEDLIRSELGIEATIHMEPAAFIH